MLKHSKKGQIKTYKTKTDFVTILRQETKCKYSRLQQMHQSVSELSPLPFRKPGINYPIKQSYPNIVLLTDAQLC